MVNLRNQELRDIIHLGNIAQTCDSLDDLQMNTVHRLQNYVEADSSVFFYINHVEENLQFKNGVSYGVPENAPQEWCDYYQSVDPFVIRFLNCVKAKRSRVVVSSDVVNQRDFVRTEFYYDFLRPQSVYHVLVAGIMEKDKPIGLLGFHRPRNARPFTDREATKVNLTLPHLTAAIQRINLSEMAFEREWIIERLKNDLDYQGVIILNESLTPIFLNKFTQEVFNVRYSGCGAVNPDISRNLPAEIYENCLKLKESVDRDEPDRRLAFTFCTNIGQIEGYVQAYNQAANKIRYLVCFGISEACNINPKNFSVFNLSRREIDIVRLVAEGMTNNEIAEKLFISFRTVENHLRSIYKKMEIHNRTSLVSRLIQLK
jgi:DNA-binding CsgD family transcriptional regulator